MSHKWFSIWLSAIVLFVINRFSTLHFFYEIVAYWITIGILLNLGEQCSATTDFFFTWFREKFLFLFQIHLLMIIVIICSYFINISLYSQYECPCFQGGRFVQISQHLGTTSVRWPGRRCSYRTWLRTSQFGYGTMGRRRC